MASGFQTLRRRRTRTALHTKSSHHILDIRIDGSEVVAYNQLLLLLLNRRSYKVRSGGGGDDLCGVLLWF